jgi:hypothetical protein
VPAPLSSAGWRAYLDNDGQAVTFCPDALSASEGWLGKELRRAGGFAL